MDRAEWTNEQKRKYEELLEQKKSQGHDAASAQEEAGKTIHDERVREGQTPSDQERGAAPG